MSKKKKEDTELDIDAIVNSVDYDAIAAEVTSKENIDRIVSESVGQALRHVNPQTPEDKIYAKERKKMFRLFWLFFIIGLGILPGLIMFIIYRIRGFKKKATWILGVTGGVIIFWGGLVVIAGPIIATPMLTGAIRDITDVAADTAQIKMARKNK